jgi:hypothetical protein
MQLLGFVGPAHRTLLQIVEQFIDYEFDLPNHNCIRML